MAGKYLRRKLRTYKALYEPNRDFAALSRDLWGLFHGNFVRHDKLDIYQDLLVELQCQISHDVVEKMDSIEERDMYHYGKTRVLWDHFLNPELTPLRNPPLRPQEPES